MGNTREFEEKFKENFDELEQEVREFEKYIGYERGKHSDSAKAFGFQFLMGWFADSSQQSYTKEEIATAFQKAMEEVKNR